MPIHQRMQGYARDAPTKGTVSGSSAGAKISEKDGGHITSLCGPSHVARSLVNVPALQGA